MKPEISSAVVSEVYPLPQLPVGHSGRVAEILADGVLRRRLLDLGLIPGTRVQTMRRGPLGDPTAYRVRGVTVAFRREDAAQILVRPLAEHEA